MIDADVYPVGLFDHWRTHKLGYGLRYLWRIARQGNWSGVRNYFNGYLAEHRTLPVSAGHGWTRKRALRSLDRILRAHDA